MRLADRVGVGRIDDRHPGRHNGFRADTDRFKGVQRRPQRNPGLQSGIPRPPQHTVDDGGAPSVMANGPTRTTREYP